MKKTSIYPSTKLNSNLFSEQIFSIYCFNLILYSGLFYIIFIFSKLNQGTRNFAMLILYWFVTIVFFHSSAAWKFGLGTFWQDWLVLAWRACVSSMSSGIKERLILALGDLLSLPY